MGIVVKVSFNFDLNVKANVLRCVFREADVAEFVN